MNKNLYLIGGTMGVGKTKIGKFEIDIFVTIAEKINIIYECGNKATLLAHLSGCEFAL
ncbi:MAG: hypothetical protein NC397_02135 [Clostridium sp.]|nr:hypothetical protein [Clostridium sp.]